MASTTQFDNSNNAGLTSGAVGASAGGGIGTLTGSISSASTRGLFSPRTNSTKWSRFGSTSSNAPSSNRVSLAANAGGPGSAFGGGNATIMSPSSSKLDSPMFRERMTTLMHQGDGYAKRLDFERRRSYELDACLRSMRDFHFETKKKLFTAIENGAVPPSEAPGAQQQQQQQQQAQQPQPPSFQTPAPPSNGGAKTTASNDRKSIRNLENRLDKVLTKYNEVCNANKLLREEIQTLRREKVAQQHIHDKLDRELHAKQNEMQKVTSATQSAYDARDRANRQVEALRAHATSENDEFEIGWVDKMQQLEEDRQSIRDIPRLRTPKNQQQRGGGGAGRHVHVSASGCLGSTTKSSKSPIIGGGAGGAGGSTSNAASTSTAAGFKLLSTPELKLRDETIKNVRLINEKEIDLRKQSERLKVVEDALVKIKKKTSVNDVNELAAAIVSSEEKNFSLFNLINDLNTEMKALEIENNEIEHAIEACKGSGRNSDSYRRQLKHDLEDQIEKSKQKVQFFEMRHAETADTMEAMKNGALSIYHKIGSHQHAIIAPVSTTSSAPTNATTGGASGSSVNGSSSGSSAAGGGNASASGAGGAGGAGSTAGGGGSTAAGGANANAAASANLASNEESFTQQMLSHGITDVNMMKLLGLIEQRVEEIVDIHNLATYATTTPHFKTSHEQSEAKHAGRHDKKGASHHSNQLSGNGGGNNGDANNNGASGSGANSGASSAGGAMATGTAGGNLLRPLPPAADDFNDSDSEEQQEDNANCILRPAKISEIQEKTAAAVGRRKDKQHLRAAARRV